ncbi:Transposase C of IS166 homeodomain-containing protein [Caenispirillum bisanense]|uniref:Transposase C of IS166 homeodomain-containing protein n=1 Tax=Caenispirillum bisanense TaxID=414052 RepID=A0A286H275_9PROT|nr:Transposase C of IS166 homeodomain-containing protein [Caenispirillum bisanense]
METGRQTPTDELDALRAELAVARARAAEDQALIAHQKLQIEKLKRALYGSSAERRARLIGQMELEFEELAASATEDEL